MLIFSSPIILMLIIFFSLYIKDIFVRISERKKAKFVKVGLLDEVGDFFDDVGISLSTKEDKPKKTKKK